MVDDVQHTLLLSDEDTRFTSRSSLRIYYYNNLCLKSRFECPLKGAMRAQEELFLHVAHRYTADLYEIRLTDSKGAFSDIRNSRQND